jgi:glutathione S-transferase
MASPKIVFGAWGIRVAGELPRLCLELSGITNYENKRYYTPEEWAKDAAIITASNPIPNLPYLQVGDRYFTNAFSIIQWVANQPGSNIIGTTPEQRLRFWECAIPIGDTIADLAAGSTEPGYVEIAKKKITEKVRPFLSTMSKILGDKDFFSDHPTLADIDLFELLEYSNGLDSTILNTVEPNLIAFHKRFLSLPAVVAYRASPRYQERPLLCKDV